MTQRSVFSGRTILVISNEPWGDMWFSKHQYAVALTELADVVFVDPPAPWAAFARTAPVLRNTEVSSRLRVLSYGNVLPFTRFLPLLLLNERIVARAISRLLAEQKLGRRMVWTFDPYRWMHPEWLGSTLSIYHAVDMFDAPRERLLCRHVNLILSSAERITRRISEGGHRVHTVPHGTLDYGVTEEDLRVNQPRDELLLAGSLSWKTDWGLLRRIAETRPTWRLRLVGKLDKGDFSAQDTRNFAALTALQNVSIEPARPAPELAGMVLDARVCLCAYKPTDAAWQMGALKIPFYLAFGRPVVSSFLEDYTDLHPRLVRIARNQDEFVQALDDAWTTAGDIDLRLQRYRLAQSRTYAQILGHVSQLIEGACLGGNPQEPTAGAS